MASRPFACLNTRIFSVHHEVCFPKYPVLDRFSSINCTPGSVFLTSQVYNECEFLALSITPKPWILFSEQTFSVSLPLLFCSVFGRLVRARTALKLTLMVSPSSLDKRTMSKGQDAEVTVQNTEVAEKEAQLFDLEDRTQAEKRLVRLLDTRLLPTVVLILVMNYIDVSGQH